LFVAKAYQVSKIQKHYLWLSACNYHGEVAQLWAGFRLAREVVIRLSQALEAHLNNPEYSYKESQRVPRHLKR